MSFNRKAGSAENTLSQTDGKMQQSITFALVLAVFKNPVPLRNTLIIGLASFLSESDRVSIFARSLDSTGEISLSECTQQFLQPSKDYHTLSLCK